MSKSDPFSYENYIRQNCDQKFMCFDLNLDAWNASIDGIDKTKEREIMFCLN